MRRLAFAVIAGSLGTACTLLTDLGALRTGGSDASSDVTDDSTPDAGRDGSMPDAPVDGEAGPKPYCASLAKQPKLCEDFDNGLFSMQFTNVHQSSSGMLASSSALFVSPPRSMLAQLQASDAAVSDYAYLTRLFVGTASSVTYGFHFRPESWTAGGKSGIAAAIVIDDGAPSQHALSFYVTDSYAAVEEVFVKNNVTQFLDHTLTIPPQLNQWTRVEIALDLTGRTASVTLDANPVLTAASLDPSWAPGTPAIDLGITYAGGQASAWSFRYDNVVVDWK